MHPPTVDPRALGRHHIVEIDLDRRGLLDQPRTQYQAVTLLFPQQDPPDPLERPSNDLYLHAFVKIGMRIVRKDARHQGLQCRDLFLGNRLRPLTTGDIDL